MKTFSIHNYIMAFIFGSLMFSAPCILSMEVEIEVDTCAVCRDSDFTLDTLWQCGNPKCKYFFHKECIINWFNTLKNGGSKLYLCPTCTLPPKDLTDLGFSPTTFHAASYIESLQLNRFQAIDFDRIGLIMLNIDDKATRTHFAYALYNFMYHNYDRHSFKHEIATLEKVCKVHIYGNTLYDKTVLGTTQYLAERFNGTALIAATFIYYGILILLGEHIVGLPSITTTTHIYVFMAIALMAARILKLELSRPFHTLHGPLMKSFPSGQVLALSWSIIIAGFFFMRAAKLELLNNPVPA